MNNFKELFEASYNIDIHGKYNPYIGLDKSKLKAKIKSFEAQISDLRSKVRRANMGSGGDKAGYFTDIEELTLKVNQANYILKGK